MSDNYLLLLQASIERARQQKLISALKAENVLLRQRLADMQRVDLSGRPGKWQAG